MKTKHRCFQTTEGWRASWPEVFAAMQLYVRETRAVLTGPALIRLTLDKTRITPEAVEQQLKPWLDTLQAPPNRVETGFGAAGRGHCIEMRIGEGNATDDR